MIRIVISQRTYGKTDAVGIFFHLRQVCIHHKGFPLRDLCAFEEHGSLVTRLYQRITRYGETAAQIRINIVANCGFLINGTDCFKFRNIFFMLFHRQIRSREISCRFRIFELCRIFTLEPTKEVIAVSFGRIFGCGEFTAISNRLLIGIAVCVDKRYRIIVDIVFQFCFLSLCRRGKLHNRQRHVGNRQIGYRNRIYILACVIVRILYVGSVTVPIDIPNRRQFSVIAGFRDARKIRRRFHISVFIFRPHRSGNVFCLLYRLLTVRYNVNRILIIQR